MQILASARALFLDQGYAATSVQQIAGNVGATKRTLYVKLGDKEALFRAVTHDVLKEWRHSVDAAGTSGTLDMRLEAVGHQLLAVVLAPDMLRLHRVLTSEAYRFPSLVQMLIQQIESGPIPQLARLLHVERGGQGAPSEDDEIAARLLYDMVCTAPVRAALTGRPLALGHPDWVHHAVSLFLCGWRRPPGIPAA